jgi:hypothetical protein
MLRRGYQHHSPRSWARLLAGLDAGDTDDEQLTRTWIAAQELRLIFSCPDRSRAAETLYRWLTFCADADIPELTGLARTIDSWRPELLAYYFDTGGISNGPTEAINLLIKKIKRVGHGSASCSTAASTGTLSAPPRSEFGYHAWWRRAALPPPPVAATSLW